MSKTAKYISVKALDNMKNIKEIFHFPTNKDIVIRSFKSDSGENCVVVYIDGMTNTAAVNDFIVRALMSCKQTPIDIFNTVEFNDCTKVTDMDTVVSRILLGDTAVFVDGSDFSAVCETKGFPRRSISTPLTENSIKGSQEAFSESIRSNISLVRRGVRTPDLITEMITVGEISNDICGVMYIAGLTDMKLVERVKKRLKSIRADYVTGSGMIEQMIGDSRWSVFPSVLSTERPERAAQYLNAGRVVIICDNSPFALIMPVTLSEFLDSPEGNQQRWQSGSFSRIIRSFAFVLALLLSAVYIAVINFHHEMLPPQLLLLIAQSRASIPFSSLMELLVMELFFELVREAGVRTPSAVGGAIGVVGGLILGSAAIDANIVSPVTLIIVAVSGLANSVLPDYDINFAVTVCKVALIILGGTLGLYGVFFGCAAIVLLLSLQRSLGLPFIEAPFSFKTVNSNAFVQMPLWKQQKRANVIGKIRPRQQPKISREWENDE